jgi:tetratricopeptide (TPR) repeat protein
MTGPSHKRLVWLALVATPVLFAFIVGLQLRIDAASRTVAQEKDELLFTAPQLKKLSLGYDSLLGDIYWTRVVQYYGQRVRKPGATFDLLWPLLDAATSLDPKLLVAYRFGAIFLSEPPPRGPGRPDLAVDLVQRGIAANPDEWHLYADLGFIYYMRMNDYQKAADAFLQGSKNPKSYVWMKVMAARIAQTGKALETSRMVWDEVYSTTTDDLIRRNAKKHLQALDAQIGLKHLNDSAEDYWRKFGRYPATIQELRDAGFVGGSLKDPAGYPYVMGPDGVPGLDPQSPVDLDPDHPKPNP